jgi:predicted GIY-YIG superfamily endonuclease
MGCLYRLRFPNGKAYIGISAKTVEARWKSHAAARARAANPEWCKKISDLKRGRSWGSMSKEAKEKIASRRRAEWQDPEMRKKRLVALEKARETMRLKKENP